MPSTTSRKVEQSRRLQQRAESMIPGGVNSPVRAFGSVGGDPPFIVRGKGSHIWTPTKTNSSTTLAPGGR